MANGVEPIVDMLNGLSINEEGHQEFEEIEIQEIEEEIKKDPTLIARGYVFLISPCFYFFYFHCVCVCVFICSCTSYLC